MRRAFMLSALVLVLSAASNAQAAERIRLAVLPVVVHSMEAGEYLRAGLVDMLTSRLGAYRNLAVVRIEDTSQATTDLATARESARTVGAEYVVFGSFTRFGDGASLDLVCARVGTEDESDPPRKLFVQSGRLGEIIPELDRVAEKIQIHIAAGGGLPPVAAGPPGADPTTAISPDILDSLSELEELQRRVDALERKVFEAGVDEVDLSRPELDDFDPDSNGVPVR